MEKTKEQLIIIKLHKAGKKTRMGMGHHHGMPPMGAHHGMGPHPCPPPGHMPPPGPCGHGHMPPHGMHHHHGGAFPREIILMTVLEAGDNGLRQKDIAAEIGINPSSLSEQIDRLETDRYLERKANPDDKRSTLICLTEKGRARAYEVQDERQKAAAAFCAKLSEEEKDTLMALLDKLLAE